MPLSCHIPQTTAERHAGYGGCTLQWVKREMMDVRRMAELPLAEWGPRPHPQAFGQVLPRPVLRLPLC